MRNYSNIAKPVILANGINDSDDTTLQVGSTEGYPEPPFLLAIERGTPKEELVLCESVVTDTSFEVVRGYGDTPKSTHSAGVLIEHVTAAIDHVEAGIAVMDSAARDALTTDIDPDTGLGNRWIGRTIFNTDDGELQTWNGTYWVGATSVGTIQMRPSASANWLLCDGSTIDAATYPQLHAYLAGLSHPFGAGDGSSATLPDFRGAFPVGAGANGLTLGDEGGDWDHVHTLPTTSSGGAHTHGAGTLATASAGGSSLGGTLNTSAAGAHTHTNPSTSSSGSHSHTNPNTQSGGSHSHSITSNIGLPVFTSGIGSDFALARLTHSHNLSTSGSHTHSQGSTGSGGGHSHTVGATSQASNHQHTVTLSGSISAHTHTISGSTASGGAHTHSFGSDSGAANPPYLAMNFYIRA